MKEIIMPQASMTMEEGKIIKWHKKAGDAVKEGEDLLTIETDKVTMEEPASASGILLKILYNEGESVPVTKTIAYIGKAGEKVPEGSVPAAAVPQVTAAIASAPSAAIAATVMVTSGKALATPAAKREASAKGIDLKNVKGTGDFGAVRLKDIANAATAAEVKASPLAKNVAAARGVSLDGIKGSGFNGKIMVADLTGAAAMAGKQAAAREDIRVSMSTMRKAISKQMSKSHAEVPPVTTCAKANVGKLLELRKDINEQFELKLSINDYIIKAVAIALRKFPRVNAQLDGTDIIEKGSVNIGMAVGIDDGLVVPVLKNADMLTVTEIAARAKELAAKAREKKTTLQDISGGTFSISNMGMFGTTAFTPIVNTPEAAILGVCTIEDVLALENGIVAVKKMMNLCLTYDHRIMDGVLAAQFLNCVIEQLERPLTLIV